MWDIINNTKKKGIPIENNNKMISFIYSNLLKHGTSWRQDHSSKNYV